jgi:hypothetical protein
MSSQTYTEWRIEVKEPGKRGWTYTPFSGATDRDEARIRGLLARERERATKPCGVAGWQFRLQSRTVTVTATSWETVE